MAFLRHIESSKESDQELLARYRQSRDLQVLARLYERQMELVYAVCFKYLQDPEEARDAVMEIFEELVKKLHLHEVENFRGWLYTLARNHCLMQLRSPRRIHRTEIHAELMQSEEPVHLNGALQREGRLNQLEKCMDSLPREQKEAVDLFYLQGLCYKEIAEKTGLDWNLVRSHIQNGRRNLKNCMEKSGVMERTTETND